MPIVRFDEFLPDTQPIGNGVVVGQNGWETVLENNKQAFTAEFVQRSRFTMTFPSTMTTAQFVDKLNMNAGNPLSQAERDNLVNSGMTRAFTPPEGRRYLYDPLSQCTCIYASVVSQKFLYND